MPAYDLYLDIANHRLVGGIDSSAAQPVRLLAQNDTPTLALHALVRDTDPASFNFYREVPFPYTAIKAGISKAIDAVPRAGTWRVRVAGTSEQSAAIPVSASKAGVQDILNAVAEVAGRGGVTVDGQGAANLFVVRWVDPGVTDLLEIVDNRLTPHSFGRVYRYEGEEGAYMVLKVFVAPFAFTDAFELPEPPGVEVAVVRAGSAAQNAIQGIRVPAGATGQVAFAWLSLQSTLVNVAGITAAAIQCALNAIIADGTTRFLVSQRASNLFYAGPTGRVNRGCLAC